VVIVVEPATFSAPATYRLEKDARKWGRFAVTPPSLAAASEPDGVQVAPAQGGSAHATRGGSAGAYRGGSADATSQRSQVVENTSGYEALKIGKDRERYTSSSSPHARAEARGLEELKEYLGQHAAAADR